MSECEHCALHQFMRRRATFLQLLARAHRWGNLDDDAYALVLRLHSMAFYMEEQTEDHDGKEALVRS